MSGSRVGAQQGAATRLGLSLEAYLDALERGLRHCFLCQQWKPEAEFNRNARSQHGRQNHCRDCIRGYMRGWMRRRIHYAGPAYGPGRSR